MYANKLTIKQVLNGTYSEEGAWKPNRLIVGSIEAERISVIGIVVSAFENGFIIDDGTGAIAARLFERKALPDVGSTVHVVGRLREANGERFMAPEITKTIDHRWLEVRRRELGDVPVPVAAPEQTEQPVGKVLAAIKALDKGEGADHDRVISEAGVANAEGLVLKLLKEGEIFELRPGRLKVLE